jgi:hypothetical protein
VLFKDAGFPILDSPFSGGRLRSVVASRTARFLQNPFEAAQIRVDMADSVSIESRQRPGKMKPERLHDCAYRL